MSNPFDYVNAVSFSKKDIMTGTENDELAEKGYNPYITNKALSYFSDSIAFANEMNSLYHLDNKLQFSFYLNILRTRKRFKKWFKENKDDNIELLCNVYGCNKTVAKQYLNILSDDQLTLLKKEQEKGGVK